MVNQQMSGHGNFWGRLLRIRCGEERLESGVYGSPSHAGWVSPVWDGFPYMQLPTPVALSNKQPCKRNNIDVNHPLITKKQTRQPQTGSRESVPLSKNSD